MHRIHKIGYTTLLLAILTTLALPGCTTPAPVPPTVTTEIVPSNTPPAPTDTAIPPSPTPTPAWNLLAGLRSSSYGPQEPFPGPDYWVSTSQAMADLFPSATPSVVWIVGEIQSEGTAGIAGLNFPAPDGQADTYPDIVFSDVDKNEEYLDQFDQNGAKVWLQVEPGDTDVLTLIDLILSRYSSHPCVIGFGVDVEWYKWDENSAPEGTAITDADAQAWSEKVRSYNPDYLLFTKHWLVEKMPPTYRTGMFFLDDSQEFSDLDSMVEEFKVWGEAFAPAPVGFQFGYKDDQSWWDELDNPPQDIGQALLDNIPNTAGLYWVDFTMEQIWPRTP